MALRTLGRRRQAGSSQVSVTSYPGTTSSKYIASGRVTSGALSALSVGLWVKPTLATGNEYVIGEYTPAGGQRAWYIQRIATAWDVLLSSDGTNVVYKHYRTPTGRLAADTWQHLAFTWGSSTLKMYSCAAVESAPTKFQDGAFSQIFNATANFTIGSIDAVQSGINGRLARVVIESAEWSAATVANVKNGVVPAGAWHWPAGDGSESQQGFAEMTKQGSPTSERESAGVFIC